MRDAVVLLMVTGFFALCVAYVQWCDHIIGPDPDVRAHDESVPSVEDALPGRPR